jgi:DNA-binding Lrp family transcriptional regulator
MAGVALSADERVLVRTLQSPLPLTGEPFAALAQAAGVPAAELLAFGERHLGGLIRRYAGTFNHRKLGIDGNGMIVWNVPPAEVECVGLALAAAPEVSHCYARNTLPDFSFNLYSMAHTADRGTCRALAASLAQAVSVDDYAVLFSTREFKKERLRYFLPDLEQWWIRHAEKECEA